MKTAAKRTKSKRTATDDKELIERVKVLSETLARHGWKIRKEELKRGHGWQVRSGCCMLQKEKLIFVDRRLSPREQVDLLHRFSEEILPSLPEGDHAPETSSHDNAPSQ